MGEALSPAGPAVLSGEGKEDYREITVGGKRTNKSMLELGGSTSTGEFASTLHSLFSPASQTQFGLLNAIWTSFGNEPVAWATTFPINHAELGFE